MDMHSTRARSQRAQEQPNEDWEHTFRQMVLFDLAQDMELGNFLAYYRNFGIPSIAETLARSGEISARPMKRSYDTAIIIYELIANGFDSVRGRQMIELLNRAHKNVPGSPDDFRYVLLTLLVVPIRWTERHGWRRPTEAEVQAATRFFSALGTRMHLQDIPATFDEAATFFDVYERDRVASSESGLSLMNSTIGILQGRLPPPLRPFTRLVISTLLEDRRLSDALGLPPSSRLSRSLMKYGLLLRNELTRRKPLSSQPRFIPGQSGSTVYPAGYELTDLGPTNLMPAE